MIESAAVCSNTLLTMRMGLSWNFLVVSITDLLCSLRQRQSRLPFSATWCDVMVVCPTFWPRISRGEGWRVRSKSCSVAILSDARRAVDLLRVSVPSVRLRLICDLFLTAWWSDQYCFSITQHAAMIYFASSVQIGNWRKANARDRAIKIDDKTNKTTKDSLCKVLESLMIAILIEVLFVVCDCGGDALLIVHSEFLVPFGFHVHQDGDRGISFVVDTSEIELGHEGTST